MKKQIKDQHPHLNLSFIDVLSELDPSKTNKYLPFLVKHINTVIDQRNTIVSEYRIKENGNIVNFIEMTLLRAIKEFFEAGQLQTLETFHELLENNQIEQKDIGQYDNFQEMENAINDALLKRQEREKEKSVYVLLDDENYLVLKPLTYEASVKYGYGTKWCTASNTTKHQWKEYSKFGSLSYCFNRKTKEKFAIHMWKETKGWRDFTIWNAEDTKIDSMDMSFEPALLRGLIRTLKDDHKSNLEIAIERGILPLEEEMTEKINDQQPQPPMPYYNTAVAATPDVVQTHYVEDGPYEETEEREPKLKNKFWQVISNFVNLFKRRKNIIIFNSGNICEEHHDDLVKRFRESNLSKTHELVMFQNMDMISFDGIY